MRFSQKGHDASWKTFWNIAFVCFCFVAGPDHVVRWLQQSYMSVAVSLLASARRLQRGPPELQGWRRRCPVRRILQTQDWHGSRRSKKINFSVFQPTLLLFTYARPCLSALVMCPFGFVDHFWKLLTLWLARSFQWPSPAITLCASQGDETNCGKTILEPGILYVLILRCLRCFTLNV